VGGGIFFVLPRPAFLFGNSMRSIVALSLHAVGSSKVRRISGLNTRQSLHGRKGGNAVTISVQHEKWKGL